MAVRGNILAKLRKTKVDPAFERWNTMREDVYKKFRWTTRTTRTAFWGLIFVPGVLYYYSSREDHKWNWTGKRKGESLLARPDSTDRA